MRGHLEEAYDTRLEKARGWIREEQDFTSDAQADDFFQTFSDITAKSSTKAAGNLLHVLVEVVKHNGLQPEKVERLARRLVEEAPDLLQYKNKDGQTPILMAIRTRQDQLLDYMISACVSHKKRKESAQNLNTALCSKHDGKPCLHAAFGEKLKPETVKMLIENASDEALSMTDHTGKTPIHHAVQFRGCTDSRSALIDLMIQRDFMARLNKPKSAKTFLDISDLNGCSVFQEHANTRKTYMEQYHTAQAAQRRKRESKEAQKEAERAPPREPRLPANARESKVNPAAKGPGDRDTERYGRSSGPSGPTDDLETDALYASRHAEPTSNTGIKRSNTARPERDPESEKRVVKPSSSSKKNPDFQSALRNREKNSNDILQKLKLYYMRTRNAEMVMFFLYGKNMDDIQIGFDYRGLPCPIPWKEFTKRFGENAVDGYKFDPVLQYATFPRVEVLVKGRSAHRQDKLSHQAKATLPGANSRKDVKYFLDRLYKKGVRHIIKLSVEDSGDSGQKVHSDEVIQSALEKFVIEHLDWQKTDLDPETILHISSKVAVEESSPSDGSESVRSPSERQLRKLTLIWSGSNAVLRAWSEQDALPLLPHLQEVEIIPPPPHMWTNQRIMEFERRLNKNRESPHEAQLRLSDSLSFSGNMSGHIRVKVVGPATGSTLGVTSNIVSPTTISTPDQGVNEDRWLRSIESFASAMAPYWEDTVTNFLETRQNSGTTERIESDVIVALIDDGVDKFEIGRPNQVLEGKSFDFHDERVNPPYLSARGHGTTMASMILRAIQAALDKNATIISMSWTLPIETGKDHMKEELHAVLKRAVENKLLMFCSAHDKGKFTELDYPSGPWPHSFFRIGAAYSNGTVFQWTPEVGITYILPGVDVVQDQLKGAGEGSKTGKNLTGSSVATALGAGLAAMIIYCVKASILSVKTANQNKAAIHPIPDDRAIQVAKPDAMKRAFASLVSTTSNKFIQVWEELDKARVILERWEREKSIPEANLKCTQEFMQFGIKLASSVKQ
ncbi:intracellular serine protease [Fusarium tjaetaba]|uniref:Intracellular serine protease n=1 Tax=Fusarium tjaetaba TaxID=1567544 RepID=A0A8H5S0P9_9HYPO|nr:intracellular serine protease [Fusarium tjaetaba]KAF5642480.1 intracellular serine protease [Fusarium tjaetaba]